MPSDVRWWLCPTGKRFVFSFGAAPRNGAEPQEFFETRRKVIDLPHIRRHSRGVVFGSAPSLVLG